MRRFSFIIIAFCFFALVFGCQGKLVEEQTREISILEKTADWLDSLCSPSFMGRKTGTEYNERVCDYLCSTLLQIGYSYDVQEFASYGGGAILRNIIVEVPGSSDKVIVIGAHYDGALLSNDDFNYQAANDNASGVVTVMAFLDSLKRSNIVPIPSLVCAFWDGEEVYDGSWVQGSSFFVQTYEKNKEDILFYLNLDSVGHDHVLYIKHKGHGIVDDIVSELISNERLSYLPIDMNSNNGGSSDYVPFGRNGVPYISFGDHNGDMCSYNSHSQNDVVEAISLDRLVTHVNNIMDMINGRYLID